MNIHFSEILVILFVALLVIKPERLPTVAFTLGRWLRWAQGALNKIKKEALESFENDTKKNPP